MRLAKAATHSTEYSFSRPLMGQSGDYMATEITVDVKLDIKLKIIDIIKLRLAGIKGQELINEFMQRMKAPTCVLVNDLAKRTGVHEVIIEPHQPFRIKYQEDDGSWGNKVLPVDSGAARILVVID